MQKKIHPTYFKDAVQRCACGAVFHIPSTQKETMVEICSQCHPFYTGKTKIVDATGQVEKFKERATKAEQLKKQKKDKKKEKTKKKKKK
ncbi:MAG TPA: 50S ribosomal protein L31 [Candidatus Pacearchaeota archaeon]|nr:50S ribosomal protein L31 [Candidatus Pacearchaeota archaeon]HOK94438.1 50S ribosomal protein L31 [Candidatus Pacearchaeota archaeon]HPO75508.1 50S ribosomal protein L31 [Candidatus Pacearchaeota archaeon]